MSTDETVHNVIYDMVGVGFGPSNLALAIVIDEHNRENGFGIGFRSAFLERQERFGWHRGMLLEGALMQMSFIKDLVTLRRPVSEFSFLNYLHERDRLLDFINRKSLYSTRKEFHDYLEWAAARFSGIVTYGAEVVDVRPVSESGRVTHLDVIAMRPGELEGQVALRTRNLVIGAGLTQAIPFGAQLSGRVWHSTELLHHLEALPEESARRFVVVGAGQSAAEVTAYLHDCFAKAEVHAVFSRYGYSPSDSSPFVNQIFDPIAVDHFYYSPRPVKESILDYHASTNYSVVDAELIDRLYVKSYAETVTGTRRLFMHRMSKISKVVSAGDSVDVAIEDLGRGGVTRVTADALIYATGYKPSDPLCLLGSAAGLCKQDSEGRVRVERDYQITTGDHVECGIYLQGGTEHSHGISSSLLSNVATRAGEIADSMLGGD
jgi:L-ornithine N5-monooxygenase